MYPHERQDEILAILEKYQYVPVSYLIETLCYSSATINRDLNALEQRQLVHRSYGGVELAAPSTVPLPFRRHKQHHAKERIAQRAAELVDDGDVIFIDGSTTTQCMGPHLADRESLTVISNNITLLDYLSEHGVTCIVLGGQITEPPSMTGGVDAVDMARSYRADKAFFSTAAVTDNGEVGDSDLYYELRRAMLRNAGQAYYLVDREKRKRRVPKVLCDFGALHSVITDDDFSTVQARYPSTEIIRVTI